MKSSYRESLDKCNVYSVTRTSLEFVRALEYTRERLVTLLARILAAKRTMHKNLFKFIRVPLPQTHVRVTNFFRNYNSRYKTVKLVVEYFKCLMSD